MLVFSARDDVSPTPPIMDLRKRLFTNLSLLLLALVACTVLIDLAFLVPDIERETKGSANLTKELIAIGNMSCNAEFADEPLALRELLSKIPLRHVRVGMEGAPDLPRDTGMIETLSSAMLSGANWPHSEMLNIHGRTLHFSPDPSSELQERLEQMGRTLVILLGFAIATIVAVWLVVDKALKPALALEEFIRLLADNKATDNLPHFKLKEYEQLATALNTLSASLTQARLAQQEFSRKIISAIETERDAIARDLHDELGQTITALSYNGKFAETRSRNANDEELANCCAEIRRHASEMNAQLKSVIKRLRPLGTEVADLVEGINDLIAAWNSDVTGIAFEFMHDESIDLMDSQQTLIVYRIAQESITNVIRHSRASYCRIEIRKKNDQIVLEISDDGVGMKDSEIRIHGGLYGIRERADMMGAELDIGNGELGGLRIRLSLPQKQLTNPPTKETSS